jgi:hypothetical protein
MEYVTDDQVLKILSEFKKNKITLVEWETPLLQRLGYPLAHQPVCLKGNMSFTMLTFDHRIYYSWFPTSK